MNIKLTNSDLETIFESAHQKFLYKKDFAVDARLQLLCHMLEAFSDYIQRHGGEFSIKLPRQIICESVDE